MVLDRAPETARGRAFGLHRAADTLGAVVGPLLGLAGYVLLDHQIRPLFAIAVIPAVLSVLLVAAVRERPRTDTGARRRELVHKAWDLPRSYWRATAVLLMFGLVNFPDALLLLRLSEIGFSVTGVILAYITYNAVYALASYPAGLLADRLRPPLVFGTGLLFFALGYIGLGLVHSHAIAWLLLSAYGLFTAATDGVGKAWISSLVPAGQQGTAQGVYQGLTGIGVLLAGLWAGLLWQGNGQLPLVLSGTVGALIGLAVLTLRTRA